MEDPPLRPAEDREESTALMKGTADNHNGAAGAQKNKNHYRVVNQYTEAEVG